MNYTKGEWIADNGDSELWGVFQKEDCLGIAYLCEPNGQLLREEESEANAHLIAAAPLGYELAKLASLISATWLDGGLLEIKESDYLEIKRLASEFLAKAEGKEE
jgi:hypothetical protein